ncbi:MAG: hypothetical protein H7A21_13475 [Spirochaetales bacterium]|nr:hypothetical protein [Leptospiraceae bacterium]MCP5482440.1 hypothetical protein [Spirochaetales bacterium]MCP5485856.1 hypothetical protein [Spirochaetales bacterium]
MPLGHGLSFRRRAPLAVILAALFVLSRAVSAEGSDPERRSDWSDLERHAEYFGSDRYERIPFDGFLVEVESWPEHYYLNLFWAYQYTDYPRFIDWNVFYLAHGLKSKVDARESSYVLPVYYFRSDEEGSRLLTPLSYHSRGQAGQAFDLYLYLAYYERGGDRSSFGLFPFIHRASSAENQLLRVLPLFQYETEAAGPGLNSSRTELFTPLFAWRTSQPESGEGSEHRSFSWMHYLESSPEQVTFVSWLGYFHQEPLADRSTLVLPGYYSRSGPNTSERLVLNVWASQNPEGGAFHAAPLFFSWWNPQQTGFAIVPLYYQNSSAAGSTTASPIHFWHSDSSSPSDQSAGSHVLLTPLFYSAADADGETLLFPGYYSHRSEAGSSRLIGNVYESESAFHVLPVYFSGHSADGATYSFSPLHYHAEVGPNDPDAENNLRSDQSAGSHVLLTPLFYSAADTDGETLLFPGYYSHGSGSCESSLILNAWIRECDEQLTSMAVVPFVFALSGERYERYFGPGFYASFLNSEDREDSSLITPVFLQFRDSHAGAEQVQTYLPGFAHRASSSETSNSSSWLVLPLWYSSSASTVEQTRAGGQISTTAARVVTPVFYTSEESSRSGLQITRESVSWAPIVPLAYRSETAGGSATLLANTFWRNDADDRLQKLWSWPLLFYSPGEEGYLFVLPAYFQPAVSEGQLSFGLLHYHRRLAERELFWLGPWLTSEDRQAQTRQRHLMPFFWSWSDRNSSGSLTLPLYFRYEDPSLFIDINAIGLSRRRARSHLPRLAGNGVGGFVLDEDVALFYDLVSLSTRVTVGPGRDVPHPMNPDVGIERLDQVQPDAGPPTQPEISRERSVTRESSQNFFGAHFFYGLAAYEEADTRRHFRVLPLSWFTWDTTSDDRALFVPGVFFDYSREDLSYRAIIPGFFPLYARQRQGASFTESYAGPTYIRSYDEHTRGSEQSVLWPLINVHNSPETGGFRVLPLLYHRDWHFEQRSLTLSPIFLQWSNPESGQQMLLPFYYRATSHQDNVEKHDLFVVPGYYEGEQSDMSGRTHTRSRSLFWALARRTVTAGYDMRRGPGGAPVRTEETTLGLYGLYGQNATVEGRETNDTQWLAPFFFQRRSISLDNSQEDSLFVSPLYYESRRQRDLAGSATDLTRSRIIPWAGLYMGDTESESVRNWLGVAGYRLDASGGLASAYLAPAVFYSRDSWLVAAPLYFSATGPGGAYEFGPFFYHRVNNREGSELLVLPGMYRRTDQEVSHTNVLGFLDWQRSDDQLDRLLVFPLYFDSRGVTARRFVFPGYYEASDGREVSRHLVPLYFSRRGPNSFTAFSPLHYYSQSDRGWSLTVPLFRYAEAPDDKSTTLVLPGFYRHRSLDSTSWLALNVWGSESPDQSSFLVAPFFFSSRDATASRQLSLLHYAYRGPGETRLVTPLSYYRQDQDRDVSTLVLPAYYRHRRGEELSQNLIGNVWYSQDATAMRRTLHVLPVYFSSNSPEESQQLIAGLYLESAPEYSRQNLLYLLDHERQQDEDSFRLLLSSATLTHSAERTSFGLGILGLPVLAGLDLEQGRHDANLLWAYDIAREDGHHNSFVPLWWYDREGPSMSWGSLPLLTFADSDAQTTFQLVGGGLVWYRNVDRAAAQETSRLLLGIAYENLRRPERGYHSTGSLWGLLWNYERESETGFRKFSLLKVLYSRTEYEGETHHRLLGLRL